MTGVPSTGRSGAEGSVRDCGVDRGVLQEQSRVADLSRNTRIVQAALLVPSGVVRQLSDPDDVQRCTRSAYVRRPPLQRADEPRHCNTRGRPLANRRAATDDHLGDEHRRDAVGAVVGARPRRSRWRW